MSAWGSVMRVGSEALYEQVAPRSASLEAKYHDRAPVALALSVAADATVPALREREGFRPGYRSLRAGWETCSAGCGRGGGL